MFRLTPTAIAACMVLVIVLAWLVVPGAAEEAAFGGIGLQVVPTVDGDLVVLNVLQDAPAAEKGLLPKAPFPCPTEGVGDGRHLFFPCDTGLKISVDPCKKKGDRPRVRHGLSPVRQSGLTSC